MSVTLWFGVVFLLGIAGLVYFVSRGVERHSRARGPLVDEFGRESGPGRITLAVPSTAAALAAFGLVGYLATRLRVGGLGVSVAAALAAAVVATIAVRRAVARWAGYAVEHDRADERYVLQGHVAKVVGSRPDQAEVEYTANGRRVVAPARSVSGSVLAVGSEVVIDRVEEGIVYVEAWSLVEQRL